MIGSFWPKHITFELRKYRKVMFNGTEDWSKIWRKTHLCFPKWHEKYGTFSPEHLKNLKTWTLMGSFIRSRKCMSLKFTEELCVMTMKNEAKFKEELKNFQVNHGQRDSIIFPQTFSVESSKQLLDLCLAESRILYFWQVLESIHKLIIELHVQSPPSLPLFFAVTAFFLQSVWRTTNCVIRSWTDH